MDVERMAMMQMATGYWVSKLIFVAARLRVADHLASGPLTAAELAARTGAHPESLHRVLRALASLGIFREVAAGTFELTPKAQYLRSDHPEGVRDFADMANGELFEAWCDLLHAVRTGEGAVQKRFGGDFFTTVLARDAEAAATFDRAMEQIHGPEVQLMLAALDWSRFRRIVDVGGGSGQTLLTLLAAHPAATGVLFDLPDVVARARTAGHPAAARCEVEGGSFFERVPAGGDCYYLRHVLHDWSDADSVRILRTCRAAMTADATLLIVEKAIPAGNDPEFVKLLDINMLVIGGKERTLEQYAELLSAAGLRLVEHHATPGPTDLIEARPV